MKLNADQEQALDALVRDQMLSAEDVLEAASDSASPLHGLFTWDDTEAAVQYRLQQASGLIRAYVVVMPNINRPVRAYVSLGTDRTQGGGYRQMPRVLGSKKMRASNQTRA